MSIAAELRNAIIDNYTIDKRLVSDAADAIEMLGEENGKLRGLVWDLYAEMITYSNAPGYNASVWAPKLRELGIEVDA